MITDRDCRITLVCDNRELCVAAKDLFLPSFSQEFQNYNLDDCLWDAKLDGWGVVEDEEDGGEARHYCPRCEAARLGVSSERITLNLQCDTTGCSHAGEVFYGSTVEECVDLARKAGWALIMGNAFCTTCAEAMNQEAPDGNLD